ncbi:RnfABCDGE type electron transport complex subunit G [Thermodesulfobacteriota bacterium]
MREMIKMVVVITVLSSVSGGLLAAVRNGTKERIEYQQLVFVKGPAIRGILEGCSNDPIVDRFKIRDEGIERSFFVGVFDGKPSTVAFETSGKGFGGDIGVMVGVDVEKDEVVGIGVTTHSETPGVGARAKTDPAFAGGFKGLSILEPFQVKVDGGRIDAVTGATITSRGVCSAVALAGDIYRRLKPQMVKDMEAFAK